MYISGKSISYSDLIKLSTIENAKDFIEESEINKFSRESHEKKFEMLEKKYLDIKIIEKLDIWPTFIEITQRRNIFVHNNGIVNNQYIDNCKYNKCNIGDVKFGDKLDVDKKYFIKSCDCLFEIALKIVVLIWRKVEPEKTKESDICINNFCFDLIRNKNFKLAIDILEFATSEFMIKKSTDELKLIFLINKARSYKWLGDFEKCKTILKNVQWDTLAPEYKLINEVLNDNYSKATELMHKIGKDNDIIKQQDYKFWPLFQNFIKENIFISAYESIYGENFVISESEIKKFEQEAVSSTQDSQTNCSNNNNVNNNNE